MNKPTALTSIRLILVRHGESEGNRDRTFTQSGEVQLTETGHAQARATAGVIAQQYAPQRIVSSPYTRARQTAEIIAAHFQLAVEFEPDLREQSFGVFAGKPYTSLLDAEGYHDGPRWNWRPPDGESLVDVSQRVVPALDRIARQSQGDTIVISHGGVMLALCAHVAGTWDAVGVTPNAGVVVIEYVDGRYTFVTGVAV